MSIDPLSAQGFATNHDQNFVAPAAPLSAPTWSGWTRCHSTFSFVFAPPRPGVFVLAEEVGAESGRRMLAVVEVAECTDLGRALSALFTGRLRERAVEARCYVRYAVVDDREERRRIQAALARSLAPSSDLVRPAAEAAAENKTRKTGETKVDQRNGITSVVVSAPDFISDRDLGDESDSRTAESKPQTTKSRQGTTARAPFPAGF